jgi:hypothetical protein
MTDAIAAGLDGSKERAATVGRPLIDSIKMLIKPAHNVRKMTVVRKITAILLCSQRPWSVPD